VAARNGSLGSTIKCSPGQLCGHTDEIYTVLDSEAFGLLALGYRKIFYAELYCRKCGTIRVGVELPPEDLHPCPLCQRSRRCSGILAVGFTRNPLPLIERWFGPVRGAFVNIDKPVVILSKPQRRELNHARYLKRKARMAAR
jgi:hypothetical protein